MASSNRHWPSMFKSKPTNTNHHHHQWPQPHDHKNPYTPEAVQAGNEARAPEPKPRWNPRPEQIRTLEAIFNSGTVNPSRDEIRRIRVQLQEYGQVGDANIFYWFQNRKSRIKQKQRQLLQNYKPRLTNQAAAAIAPASSSSSSSSSNNSNYEKALPIGSASVVDLLNKNNNNNYNKSSRRSNNSPTVSVDQPTLFQAPVDFPTEPSFSLGLTQGFCLPESVGNCSSANLMNELILMSDGLSKKDEDEDVEKMKMKEHLIASPSLLGETSPPKTTVFINDVCFEIGNGPFNVRETFGDDAVLIHSAGQPVLTNEWGLTQQPLQHGMFYYLIRAFNRSPDHGKIV